MDEILLIKIIEKYDYSVKEMAKKIIELENMVEHFSEKMNEQKKEIKELEENYEEPQVPTIKSKKTGG